VINREAWVEGDITDAYAAAWSAAP
jgi:hypothetical protein